MIYESIGKVFVGRDGSVKLICDSGIIQYYKYVIEKANLGLKTQLPKHGAHISIVLPTKHSGIDVKPFDKYKGVRVSFKYDSDIQFGKSSRGFSSYWLKVESRFVDSLKKRHHIVDSPTYRGLHLTICNTKYILNNKN